LRLHHSGGQVRKHPALSHAFWGACGSIVLLFIFFAALGAFEPWDALEVTAVVLALAVAFLAHEWLGLWRDERSRETPRRRS
jgi:hypothetical protein